MNLADLSGGHSREPVTPTLDLDVLPRRDVGLSALIPPFRREHVTCGEAKRQRARSSALAGGEGWRPAVGGIREDLERTFRTWLRLSKDEEVLILLQLVEGELRHRQYTVKIEIEPPSKMP